MNLTIGYTNTDAQDVHPMASSVAYTNANENLVTLNPNDPSPARSNWEIEHRFTSTLNWMANDKTNVSLFYQLASGNPYSLSVNGNFGALGISPAWRTGDFPSIPLYIGDDATYEETATGLSEMDPGLYVRNEFTSDWSSRIDLKVTHSPMDNLDVYMVVKNLGNLLNSEWGAYKRTASANSVATSSWDANGAVTYSDATTPNINQVIGSASIWNIKLGFKYSY